MILHTVGDEVTVEQLAAEMVDMSMSKRESVCSILNGIPLVTYPNDTRTREVKIKNLTLAFMDSFLRSQMRDYSVPENDPRFDPKFRCEICETTSSRAQMLEEMLAALANLARQKMPEDKEIVALTGAATTILMGSAFLENMATSLRSLLKP